MRGLLEGDKLKQSNSSEIESSAVRAACEVVAATEGADGARACDGMAAGWRATEVAAEDDNENEEECTGDDDEEDDEEELGGSCCEASQADSNAENGRGECGPGRWVRSGEEGDKDSEDRGRDTGATEPEACSKPIVELDADAMLEAEAPESDDNVQEETRADKEDND